MLQPAA
jgi:hypothetical protein